MSGLRHAFKEWAVICQALAEGRQAVVLRKGGIAEKTDEFQVEHTRFWLYPTYLHQQRDGVTADALPLLEQAVSAEPGNFEIRMMYGRALRDRMTAIEHVSRHLRKHGPRRAKRWYDESVVADDLRYYVNVLDTADEEYRELVETSCDLGCVGGV